MVKITEIARLDESNITFAEIASKTDLYADTIVQVLIGMGEDSALEDYPEEGDVEQQLHASARHFAGFVQGGRMAIYRALTPDQTRHPSRDGLGIYWTYDMGKAYPYRGDRDNYIVVSGEVAESDINVWATLAMDFTALTEAEIRLFPTAKVTVTEVHDQHDNRLDTDWIGQTFLAKDEPPH